MPRGLALFDFAIEPDSNKSLLPLSLVHLAVNLWPDLLGASHGIICDVLRQNFNSFLG